MKIMCTFARIVGATRYKNHNSVLARDRKKVAHHYFKMKNYAIPIMKKKHTLYHLQS